MSLYYLKVNENKVLSTKVTYEDVVWLIQEYINKNNKVPSYNDFCISNNLPVGHTLKKILREICNDYNATNKNVTELSNIYGLATTTIRRYLNNGTKLNWCKYDSELSKRNYQTEEYGQKIIAENIITHDKINFDSINSASQKSIKTCGVAMSNS